MGLRASKQSKATKEINSSVKQASINSKKWQLGQIKQHVLQYQDNQSQVIVHSSNGASHGMLDVSRPEASLFLIDTAIQQLDRNGKTLIKADLIAIIVSLRPEYVNMIEELQTKFTVEDLNSLIRTIIYDPAFLNSRLAVNQKHQKQQNPPLQNKTDKVDLIM
jgi:hypothetical protein